MTELTDLRLRLPAPLADFVRGVVDELLGKPDRGSDLDHGGSYRAGRGAVRPSTGRRGPLPFGHPESPDGEREVKVVERMRELRAEGLSVNEIAKRVNRLRWAKPRRAKKWSASSVAKVLGL